MLKKSGFSIVYEGALAGLANHAGEVVLPCAYDKILDYDEDGYVRFIKDGIYGTVDLQGNISIPLSARLTHLGVFHKGAARAQIDGVWGLVDEAGKPLTDFVYRSMLAHHGNGYAVVTLEGQRGWLTDKGNFTPSSKPPKATALYSYIAAYRNHVAPAVAKNGRWVFIDENQQRINDIEYWSMDHVLRHGVYYVAKGPNAYGIANFEGVPLIDEWYDHPVRFENGFAECDKKRYDESGNEMLLPNGQPAYYYGVLSQEGKYVFPLRYTTLHWNDYSKKDCWFAEDDDWAYLLYPDGRRKVYRKSEVTRDADHEYISEEAKDRYVVAGGEKMEELPQLVASHPFSLFNEVLFLSKLSDWMGNWYNPLRFYYRDTDADIEVGKLYKPGRFVRTDCEMLVSRKLLRPVHKLRFLIAARNACPTERESNSNRQNRNADFQNYKFPAYTNFLVVDVQHYGNTTQVVLLHFPHGALLLAKKFKVKSQQFKPQDEEGEPLRNAAFHDLQLKFGDDVHGHSLQPDWCEAMRRPVGCNSSMKLNPLILLPYTTDNCESGVDVEALRSLNDRDEEWCASAFTYQPSNTIKLFKGNITRRIGDVMIRPVSFHEESNEPYEKVFSDCLDKVFLEQCANELPAAPGALLLTEAYGLPYKKIIHVRLPEPSAVSSVTLRLFKKSLDCAFGMAEEIGAQSLLLPYIRWGGQQALKVMASVVMHHLYSQRYKGDIEIFFDNDNDIAACRTALSEFTI